MGVVRTIPLVSTTTTQNALNVRICCLGFGGETVCLASVSSEHILSDISQKRTIPASWFRSESWQLPSKDPSFNLTQKNKPRMPHEQPSRWIMKPVRSVLMGYMQTSHAERCTFASSTSSDFRDALGRCTLLRDILIAAINSDGNTHAHRLIKQQPSFSSTTLLAITPTSQ